MTTLTDIALQSGSGQFGFVLAVEGYQHLITDAVDTAAVLAAWASSEWTKAHPGLKVVGGIKQSIEPLKPDLDVPELTFQILDFDGNDTFGKAVWRSKPTISSRLDDVFEPAADGSGTLRVRSNTGFSTSGVGYLGTKTVTYSGKVGATDFTVGAGGANTFAALDADTGNRYTWPNHVPTGGFHDVAAPPRFSDVPRTWIGKKVALYIHRIRGGVWDVRAQARLEFAGKILKIEEGEPGIVTVRCRDLRADVENAVLLRNQWIGYVRPGIYLSTKDEFRAQEFRSQAGTVYAYTSGGLTVVESGAVGVAQLNAGYYEFDDFLDKLNIWLKADATLAGRWSVIRTPTEEGSRTLIRATNFGDSDPRKIQFLARRAGRLRFMGFTEPRESGGLMSVGSEAWSSGTATIVSDAAPFRVKALQIAGRAWSQLDRDIELESSDGQWFDHAAWGPQLLQEYADDPNQSYVMIGEKQLAIANYASPTLLTSVSPIAGFGQVYEDVALADIDAPGITFDDEAEKLEVRQVVVMTGAFSELVPRLIASIDGRGVNHATYDAFPWGAAVPWSVLGDTFVNSCRALEQTGQTDTISIILDRPTPLKDVLVPEMALRFAFLVFKDGVYQFVSPPTPNSLESDHVLDETNKAVAGGRVPPTRSEWVSDNLVNVIKINQGKNHAGEFVGNPLSIYDEVSIETHGESQAMTIDAVNSISEGAGVSGSVVDELAGLLAARLFPMFGHPVKIVTRTIAPTLYHMAPGDTVALSDDLVRDMTTGGRGVVSRACICLSVFHDYGHEGGQMAGEVTLLLTDEDRTYPLAPAAEVDTTYTSGLYTNGYNATDLRLKLKDHSFSRAADAVDAAQFAAGDLVRIVEYDPADPSTIDAWSRTVASVDTVTGYVQLTAAITTPSWTGATKRFALIPQSYTSVQASQKLAAFQADDADGMIQDVAEPNAYGTTRNVSFAAPAIAELPALLAAELAGDGKPLTPLQVQTMARMVNNLVNYKSAPHTPQIGTLAFSISTVFEIVFVLPFWVGGLPLAGRPRYLYVAPQMQAKYAGDTATVRVTTSHSPPTGDATTEYQWSGKTRSVTFTTTANVMTVMARQPLLPIPGDRRGYTWLTVEAKTTNVNGTGGETDFSIPTLYLGPLE